MLQIWLIWDQEGRSVFSHDPSTHTQVFEREVQVYLHFHFPSVCALLLAVASCWPGSVGNGYWARAVDVLLCLLPDSYRIDKQRGHGMLRYTHAHFSNMRRSIIVHTHARAFLAAEWRCVQVPATWGLFVCFALQRKWSSNATRGWLFSYTHTQTHEWGGVCNYPYTQCTHKHTYYMFKEHRLIQSLAGVREIAHWDE